LRVAACLLGDSSRVALAALLPTNLPNMCSARPSASRSSVLSCSSRVRGGGVPSNSSRQANSFFPDCLTEATASANGVLGSILPRRTITERKRSRHFRRARRKAITKRSGIPKSFKAKSDRQLYVQLRCIPRSCGGNRFVKVVRKPRRRQLRLLEPEISSAGMLFQGEPGERFVGAPQVENETPAALRGLSLPLLSPFVPLLAQGFLVIN